MTATLYHAHDPMCSWCWGFAPVWKKLSGSLLDNLSDELVIENLLGGLAPDSAEPMPPHMQQFLQQTWANIAEQIPGTRFNFDFWTKNTPRRSTWPACRAVIAARNQGAENEHKMIEAIQQGYYLEAKNPSDNATLEEMARALQLDIKQFSADLNAEETRSQHQTEMIKVQSLGIQGFPSLVLVIDRSAYPIRTHYRDATEMYQQIHQTLLKSFNK